MPCQFYNLIAFLQVLDILKTVKLSMLQTQSFEPRDIVDVLKSLPEKDLLEQLEVRASCCMHGHSLCTCSDSIIIILLILKLSRVIKKGTVFPGFLHNIIITGCHRPRFMKLILHLVCFEFPNSSVQVPVC